MKAYPYYPQRKIFDLDGLHDFAWLGSTVTLADFVPGDVTEYPEKAAVPGVFDLSSDHYGQRGLAVYRFPLYNLPENRSLRLRIGGLGLAGRVFYDGTEIARSLAPYVPVTADINSGSGNVHELLVAVDNRFDAQTPYAFFKAYYDFYGFGGIYRSISLEVLPETDRLERVQVTTLDLNTGKVALKILTDSTKSELACRITFDHGEEKALTLPCKDGVAEWITNVPDFRIWSPESPALHTVTVALEGDSIVERFGLRTIEAKDGRIILNGKAIFFDGINRHESDPQLGPVQTLPGMLQDIQLIKNAGMNFIRSVHYIPDQAWLDLCDETGMLLWIETLGWGLGASELTPQTLPYFMEQNRIMIRDAYNHPSVLILGMLNECASDAESSVEFYGELLKDMRKEDPTRLRSFAGNKNVRDLCMDHVDVISLNCYPGWIEDIKDCVTLASETIKPHLTKLADFYSQKSFGGKPIFISEIGACGLYGIHDDDYAQWSEEFQADFMRTAAEVICEDGRFCGYTLWQFCDTRSYQRGHIRTKPRGFNCAGIVDEYRRKKLVYNDLADFIKSRKKD